MDSKTCPKCGSPMQGDRHLQELGSEVELVTDNGYRGDKLKAFYCDKCGYVELYRIKRDW
jgi:predicted nucleic-acid-binding Zn-ribbon protein